MASKLVIDTSKFEQRCQDYVVKMEAASAEAARLGLELVISEAMMRAPSPDEEERLMNIETYDVFGHNGTSAAKEYARNRFFHGPGTVPVQVALALPQVWTLTETGFYGPNIAILDLLTRFSWTNAKVSSKGDVQTFTYTSDHGTFLPLEFGLVYQVLPKNGQGLGIRLLSPAIATYATEAVKSVPALDMLRGISPQVILDAMAVELSKVEF